MVATGARAGGTSNVQGDLTFQAMSFADGGHLRGDGLLIGLSFVKNATDNGNQYFRWNLSAQRLAVEITIEGSWGASYRETGPNFASWGSREERSEYENASGESVRTTGAYTWMYIAGNVDARRGERFEIEMEPRNPVAFRATDTLRFWTEERTATLQLDPNFPPSVSFEPRGSGFQRKLPNVLGDLAHLDETIVVRGNFTLDFFDLDFRARDAGAPWDDYQTGRLRGRQEAEIGEVSAGERDTYTAHLTVERGELRLESLGRPVQVNLVDGSWSRAANLLLDDADGQLRVEGAEQTLDSSRLELVLEESALEFNVSRQNPQAPRIGGRLEGYAKSVTLDNRSIAVSDTRVDAPGGAAGRSWPVAAWLGGAAGLGGVLLWIRMRRRGATLERAVQQLGRRRFGRASALAEILLRKDPADLDATLVKATGLYKRGRTTEALEFLSAQRLRIPDPDGFLRLALGIGLLKAGRGPEGQRHIDEALRDNPSIADLLVTHENLDAALAGALPRRSSRKDHPEGYA